MVNHHIPCFNGCRYTSFSDICKWIGRFSKTMVLGLPRETGVESDFWMYFLMLLLYVCCMIFSRTKGGLAVWNWLVMLGPLK